jgi:hypothetical protein
MFKEFIRGFIFMFIVVMLYLIAVNVILTFMAEGLGLYENIPLYIVLALSLNIAPFAILIITDRIRKKKVMAEMNEFMKYGTRANAEILEIRDTGVTINDDPVVRITLKVNPNSTGTFTHTTDMTVSRIKIPRVADIIRVIYDPKDLSNFSIEN